MSEEENNLNANVLSFDGVNYHTRFRELLTDIYGCYKHMIADQVTVPSNDENKIRDILVDDYLISMINNYVFKKEEENNLGRVDIYIVDTLTDDKPHFIIECKRLDSKMPNSKDGLNGKYITNGIQRFLTEHYYLENNFNTNAMIGFVVEELNIESNIAVLNDLTEIILKNMVEITLPIQLETECIYRSAYQTGKPEKDFVVYHLMMDFSANLIVK